MFDLECIMHGVTRPEGVSVPQERETDGSRLSTDPGEEGTRDKNVGSGRKTGLALQKTPLIGLILFIPFCFLQY